MLIFIPRTNSFNTDRKCNTAIFLKSWKILEISRCNSCCNITHLLVAMNQSSIVEEGGATWLSLGMAFTILPLVKKIILLIFHSYLIIGRSFHITNLPDEVLQEVFEYVWCVDGDAAIVNLSLVCRSLGALVGDGFRHRVHFRWLCIVHDWEKASPAFREQYYVMYQIYECLGCKRRYKDMPGYVRRGKGSLSFYEGAGDANHPDYCLPLCGSIMGIFRPFWWLVWWSTVAFTVTMIRKDSYCMK